MGVLLVSPDERVVGIGFAGVLIAATPIYICHGIYQVVVGNFLQRGRDQKLKKPKYVVGYARTTITRATEVSAEPSQAKLLMLKKRMS
ncbi:hypothetical protein RYX36_016054 [Vicia faba]